MKLNKSIVSPEWRTEDNANSKGKVTIMLYGNVIPKADVMYRLGFAWGIACRKTAGAAINDALARSKPNMTDPPKLNPIAVETKTPITPLNVGMRTAKAVRKIPTFLISPNLWPAIIPISIIKITIAPVNISSNTILIGSNPSSPIM